VESDGGEASIAAAVAYRALGFGGLGFGTVSLGWWMNQT
jgi:hypothetical protein